MKHLLMGSALTAVAAAMAGCSAGSTTPPPAPIATIAPPPPPAAVSAQTNFQSSEFDRSTSAKESNAIEAWEHGATGKGIKIGFVDSGIFADNPDFAGKIDPASRDIAGNRPMADDWGHGTALASIAAGASNDIGIQGVAFDATILMFRADEPGSCPDHCNFTTDNLEQGVRLATQAGAKVISLSMSGDVTSGLLDAVSDAAKAGVIIVVSAGNNHASNPSAFSEKLVSEAPGQVIIAGALGVQSGAEINYNTLSAISNAAGDYKDWFLGAPGYMVNVAYQHDGMNTVSGTSFAAPAVAGAVALLRQAFPNLSANEVVQILLTTADDLGQAGADTEFGQGRLNIGKAFQPIGQTALAGSSVLASPLENGVAPLAAGDAFQKGSLNAVVLDAYKRAFTLNLAKTIKGATASAPLTSMIMADVRTAPLRAGELGFASATANVSINKRMGFAQPGIGPRDSIDTQLLDFTFISKPFAGTSFAVSKSNDANTLVDALNGQHHRDQLNISELFSSPGFMVARSGAVALRHSLGPFAVSASHEKGRALELFVGDNSARYTMTNIAIGSKFDRTRLSLGLSRLSENQTVLGGRFDKLFGQPGSKTLFLDAKASRSFGAWSFSAGARHGWTTFAGGKVGTSGYSLGISRDGVFESNDGLAFHLSQPLRIERGGMNVMLPGSYDYSSTSAPWRQAFMSLSPSGREIVGELGYTREFTSGVANFNLFGRREPGHAATAHADFGGVARFVMRM